MKTYLTLIVIMTFLLSCDKGLFDGKLHLEKEDYTGNQLRIDGYYDYIYSDSVTHTTYFLYRSGVILYGGSTNGNILELEEDFLSEEWQEIKTNDKTSWGIFIIKEDVIKFERWSPRMFPPTYVREGKILNDTTFIITKVYKLKNNGKEKGEEELNETYRFKQFSPKPDSTNNFID